MAAKSPKKPPKRKTASQSPLSAPSEILRAIHEHLDVSPAIASKIDRAFREHIDAKGRQMEAHKCAREARLLKKLADRLENALEGALSEYKTGRRTLLKRELGFTWRPALLAAESEAAIERGEEEITSRLDGIRQVIAYLREGAEFYERRAREVDPGIDRNPRGGQRSYAPLANLWQSLLEISSEGRGSPDRVLAYNALRILSADLRSFPELKRIIEKLDSEHEKDHPTWKFDPETDRGAIIEVLDDRARRLRRSR